MTLTIENVLYGRKQEVGYTQNLAIKRSFRQEALHCPHLIVCHWRNVRIINPALNFKSRLLRNNFLDSLREFFLINIEIRNGVYNFLGAYSMMAAYVCSQLHLCDYDNVSVEELRFGDTEPDASKCTVQYLE